MPHLLLGTYTDRSHIVAFTPPTKTSQPEIAHIADIAVPRASWWAKHPKYSDIWYAALEADDNGGKTLGVEGFIGVYRITLEGQCECLGQVSAKENPCHVAVVAGGAGLAVANFTGGSALLIPLKADGTFLPDAPNNYIRFPQVGEAPPMCHQCRDMPDLGECWVVDTGNSLVQRLAYSVKADQGITWSPRTVEHTLAGHGARQIWVSEDAKHLYTLNARSCTLTHHDLSKEKSDQLVSIHNILPQPHEIDMNARVGPPFVLAAALSYHAASRSLIATSRLIHGEPVDSVAFFRVAPDGTVTPREMIRPSRGREYRGVGLVGDSVLVAGQTDGWLTCISWDQTKDEWEEKVFKEPVYYQEVVDIQVM